VATDKAFVSWVMETIGHPSRFTTRPMFGEYGLYADNTIVGLICDNRLLIKPVKQSECLEDVCKKVQAYPGSKLYYLVTEEQLDEPEGFCKVMFDIARHAPKKKKPKKKT